MAFLALKKRETFFNIRLHAQEVIQGHAIETRRNGFFDNEAIFVFITPRSRTNLRWYTGVWLKNETYQNI